MSVETPGPADERLRELFVSSRDPAASEAGHPDPGKIFDATRGVLPPEETGPLLDHSLSCESCALAFRLAREVVAQVEPAPISLEARRASFAPKRTWAFAGAGALVAAAAAVFIMIRPQNPAIYRADAIAITSLLDPSPLPRDAFLLRWSPLGAGARYSVNVATQDLTVLFTRGGITEAQVQVPAAALEKVASGTQVVWRVTALLPDGRRAESSAFLSAVK